MAGLPCRGGLTITLKVSEIICITFFYESFSCASRAIEVTHLSLLELRSCNFFMLQKLLENKNLLSFDILSFSLFCPAINRSVIYFTVDNLWS